MSVTSKILSRLDFDNNFKQAILKKDLPFEISIKFKELEASINDNRGGLIIYEIKDNYFLGYIKNNRYKEFTIRLVNIKNKKYLINIVINEKEGFNWGGIQNKIKDALFDYLIKKELL
jgi:hypothetical protein